MEEKEFDLVVFTNFAMQDPPQPRVLCSFPYLSHSPRSRDPDHLPSGVIDLTRTRRRHRFLRVPTNVW